MSNTVWQQMQIFKRMDALLGQYYSRLGINNYFNRNTGNGKFLQFIIDEEYSDYSLSIEDELGDDCLSKDCGYLSFDQHFPVHPMVGLLMNWNTEKDIIIFYILQYCYKHNKLPNVSDIQNKLLSLDIPESKESYNIINDIADNKMNIIDEMNVICNQFQSKLMSHIARFRYTSWSEEIVDILSKTLKHEQYTTMSELRDDLEIDTDSFIMDEIMTNNNHNELKQYRSNIFDILQSIVYNYYLFTPFDIKEFKFDINTDIHQDEIVKLWNEYDDGHCMLYSSGDGVAIKVIDFVNKFPLFISIIDVYQRYHVNQIKQFWMKNNNNNKEEYCFYDDIISHSEWFNLKENTLGKYCKLKGINYVKQMIFEMDILFKHSLIGWRCNSMEYAIYDSYDIFTRYTIAFNRFIHSISHKTAKPISNYLPIQIDFWLIPRVSMKRKENMAFPTYNDSDIDDDDDEDEDEDEFNDPNISKWEPQCVGKWDEKVWKIEDNLKNAQYVKNKDYFVLNDDDDEKYGDYRIETLLSKMNKLWKQNKKWEDKPCKRYIMVIDRRNPEHIKNKKMLNDSDCVQTWNDKIYLIHPKQYGIISKECDYKMNECFLQNTFKYILPMTSDNLTAHLSNKLFVISYHIHFRNKVNIYWYSQHGTLRFYMEDIDDLWPRYFKKINNGYQTLTDYTSCKLKENLSEYRLKDQQFDQFKYQMYGK